jgi:general secretion pathway protein G
VNSAKHKSSAIVPPQQGFTLLELVVVISIISILFVYAAERLLKLQVEAERVSVLQIKGILQSALAMQIAEHIVHHRLAELDKLIGSNPMDLLAQKPDNYLGVREHVDPATIEGGRWYYAKDEKALIYRVRNDDYFRSPLPGPARIRLRIVPVYDDNNGDGRFERGVDTLKGLSLAALEPYEWLTEPIKPEDYLDLQRQ